MTHDDFDNLPIDAVRSYNAPPPTPRDQMWDAIARARDEASIIPIAPRLVSRRVQRWLVSAAGMAAVLVIGIAIGRSTRQPATSATVATHAPTVSHDSLANPDSASQGAASTQVASTSETAPALGTPRSTSSRGTHQQRVASARRDATSLDVSGDEGAYRLAVVEHLTRTEVLLTGFRAESRQGSDAKLDAQLVSLSRDLLGTTRLLMARRSGDPTLSRLLEDLELVLMQLSQYANGGRRADFDAVNQSIEKRNVLPKLRSTIPAGTALSSGT
jgi:hypothetical protein